MRFRAFAILSAAWLLLGGIGCGRTERASAEAVRAVRSRLEPRFEPPADARLTDAQIDMYIRVRRAAGDSGSTAQAARQLGGSPGEFDWVRSRIIEALIALDSRQATAAAVEGYNRALATLREARRGAMNAASANRIESEIAALERERQTIRRPDPFNAVVAVNAARIEKRRAEIESAGP